MRFNNLLNNFTAGEWSPKARARTDAQQYFSACETLLNFIPQIHGGAFRRPGTRRVVLDAAIQSDIQSCFDVSHPFQVKSKMIPKVLANGTKQFMIANDSTPSSKWVVIDYLAPAGTGVALGSVSSGADYTSSAASLKYTQIGDLVFIADGTGQNPVRLWTPLTYTGGTLQLIDNDYVTTKPWETVPYLPIQANGSSVNLTPSATTGAITLTASSSFFNASHVGAYFKLSNAAVTGVVRITGYTNATTVSATVLSQVAATAHGTAAGTSWEESAWSNYRGWPKTVTAHEGRIYFGGSASYPDTIWASRAGNVFSFMERPFEQDSSFTGYTQDNSRPFTLTPNSKEASNIRALSSSKSLLIHTDRSEIVAYGTQGILGPNDFNFESSTSFGSTAAMPVRVNNFALFVQKGGRKLRDIIFNFQEDQYKSSDVSFLADHLTLDQSYNPDDTTGGVGGQYLDPIVEIIGSTNENSVAWAKTQNGRLLALVVDRDYNVNAWAQVKFGGGGYQRADYPLVKSICAIDGGSGEGDRLFVLLQRRINGANIVVLEELFLQNEYDYLNAGSDLKFVECAYVDSYTRGATADGLVWTGFTDYVGELLQVYADGQYIGDKIVDGSGHITITTVATNLAAGYKYLSRIKTLPIEIGQQVPNTPQGMIKRVDEMVVKFYRTRGAKYGYNEANLYDIDFKDQAAAMNAQPVMFTGYKRVLMPTDYDRECQLIIEQDKPFPCNVLAVLSRGMTYG